MKDLFTLDTLIESAISFIVRLGRTLWLAACFGRLIEEIYINGKASSRIVGISSYCAVMAWPLTAALRAIASKEGIQPQLILLKMDVWNDLALWIVVTLLIRASSLLLAKAATAYSWTGFDWSTQRERGLHLMQYQAATLSLPVTGLVVIDRLGLLDLSNELPLLALLLSMLLFVPMPYYEAWMKRGMPWLSLYPTHRDETTMPSMLWPIPQLAKWLAKSKASQEQLRPIFKALHALEGVRTVMLYAGIWLSFLAAETMLMVWIADRLKELSHPAV